MSHLVRRCGVTVSEISAALAKGWGWLMTHGLVVRDPSQSSADAYRVIWLGEETVQHGLAKLTAGDVKNQATEATVRTLKG